MVAVVVVVVVVVLELLLLLLSSFLLFLTEGTVVLLGAERFSPIAGAPAETRLAEALVEDIQVKVYNFQLSAKMAGNY